MLSRHRPAARRRSAHALAARAGALALPFVLTACATAPPPSGALSSYSDMTKSKALRTQASVRVDTPVIMAARTIRLEPIIFTPAIGDGASAAQRALISNAVARKLCASLSQRFEVVGAQDPADLSVRTTITRIKSTNAGAAAASVVVSHLSPIPLTPRIPIGLGGFSAEGEAIDPAGRQEAAMIWSRDADLYGGKRISSIGDAWDFSEAFAGDWSKLLLTGKDPVHDIALPKLPRRGKHPGETCRAYGKGPGVAGFIGGHLGAPPEWTEPKPPAVASLN